MALPTISDEQRRQALAKAVRTRQERAKLKGRLKDGSMTLNQVLSDSSNPVIAKMRVKSLLEALPGVGKVSAKKIMNDIGISETRRIQGLGTRQRDLLLKELS